MTTVFKVCALWCSITTRSAARCTEATRDDTMRIIAWRSASKRSVSTRYIAMRSVALRSSTRL